MADKPQIRFPQSNSLKFVRLEKYATLPESDNTRLYYDFNYTSISNSCYFLKVRKADDLWVQYRTNYSGVRAYIVDTDGIETDIGAFIVQGIELTEGRFQYELNLDLATYEGKYCLKFYFDQDGGKPVATFQSEWFEVSASFQNCLVVEYRNGESKPYNDGMVWGSTPQRLIIESRISDYIPAVQKSVFMTENYKQVTTQSQPTKVKKWELELLPDYLLEKLNIAMQKQYFLINGVRYNAEGTFESERQGDTRLYSATIDLNVVEDETGLAYEDYSQDDEITGDMPPETTDRLLINTTDYLLITDTDYLLI